MSILQSFQASDEEIAVGQAAVAEGLAMDTREEAESNDQLDRLFAFCTLGILTSITASILAR